MIPNQSTPLATIVEKSHLLIHQNVLQHGLILKQQRSRMTVLESMYMSILMKDDSHLWSRLKFMLKNKQIQIPPTQHRR